MTAGASKNGERLLSDHHRAPHPFAIDGPNQKSENPKHPLRNVGQKKPKLHEEDDSQTAFSVLGNRKLGVRKPPSKRAS
jgi:hypothetical protein